tara:strand:+ start:153 stop:578 length:426 start_codon:yes stop_codon:yes gene_type:complete
MTSRRDFIKTTGTTALGVCCGLATVSVLQGCSIVKEIPVKVANKEVKIPLGKFLEETELIAYNDRLPAPIFIKKISEEKYEAFLMLCTHKVCELKATNTNLICPCHGSEFSKSGKVLEGPAPTDLKEYKTELITDYLIITL